MFESPSPPSLVAGEKGAVFALEELLAIVAVPVVPTQTLHVSGAKFAELTGEDDFWTAVAAGQTTRFGDGRHWTAGGQLVLTELLIGWI